MFNDTREGPGAYPHGSSVCFVFSFNECGVTLYVTSAQGLNPLPLKNNMAESNTNRV